MRFVFSHFMSALCIIARIVGKTFRHSPSSVHWINILVRAECVRQQANDAAIILGILSLSSSGLTAHLLAPCAALHSAPLAVTCAALVQHLMQHLVQHLLLVPLAGPLCWRLVQCLLQSLMQCLVQRLMQPLVQRLIQRLIQLLVQRLMQRPMQGLMLAPHACSSC